MVKDAFYIQSLRVFVGTLNTSYRSNKFGQVLTGEHHINGDDYYFSNSGSPVTDIVKKGGKDYYYFEGKLLKTISDLYSNVRNWIMMQSTLAS
ncbi:MAG: hypothetical protein ACLTZB_04435 [Streptococcus salivarius]